MRSVTFSERFEVRLDVAPERLRLEVHDEGGGFVPEVQPSDDGLQQIRDGISRTGRPWWQHPGVLAVAAAVVLGAAVGAGVDGFAVGDRVLAWEQVRTTAHALSSVRYIRIGLLSAAFIAIVAMVFHERIFAEYLGIRPRYTDSTQIGGSSFREGAISV
mgnify:CR=1 FL=1